MSGNFVQQGKIFADRAIAADSSGWEPLDMSKLTDAYKNYVQATNYFSAAVRNEKNQRLATIIEQKASEYKTRADYLKTQIEKSYETPSATPGGGASMEAKNKKGGGGDDNDESMKMREALSGAIVSEKPNVKWDDVAGLEGAKEALKEAVILPLKFPQLFTGQRKPWKGILMYGPPGTGKSYLAKAVATEADSQFFSVSSADLVSKWQGESEKLVRELFRMAAAAKPSIIFIDEIDSLASSRSDSESESARRIKTEFLVQMQGVGNSLDKVLVLAATNIPWGLDSAIRRRFERRIYIPLPDLKARSTMLRIHLGNTPNVLTDQDFEAIGRKTEGYSGSDLSIVVRDAIMMPVRTLQQAQYFKRVSVEENGRTVSKVTPCTPGDQDPSKFPSTLTEIQPDELLVPKITMFDFERAIAKSKPSVSSEDLKGHEKFTSEFGQEGD